MDLLQDLFACMTRAKLQFVPGRDRAFEWLEKQVKALAGVSQADLVIARATDGDPDAVAQVMEEYSEMLLEEARAVLGASLEFDAEDVVQDLGEHLLEGALTLERGARGGIGLLRRTVRGLARDRRNEVQERAADERDVMDDEIECE